MDIKKDKQSIKISIRSFVEFVLRRGSIDNRFRGTSRTIEAIKLHKKHQNNCIESIKENPNKKYLPEYILKHELNYKEFNFLIEGRADGIIIENDVVIVDEIKTTSIPITDIKEDYNPLHWAQVQCYAYIYCIINNLLNIIVQITYYNIDSEEIIIFKKDFSIKELETFFMNLINIYYEWARKLYKWQLGRNNTINKLDFPFDTYRIGQREMAISVYRTILEGKKLYIEAPTGIGKTISTIFPSVKALGERKVSKIIYLTAKTITRKEAEKAFKILRKKGLKIKVTTLTAKEKICFNEEKICNPDKCVYANGHFDRINEAIFDIYTREDNFNRETIEKYAKKYKVCPFEFSLDLVEWCDAVICDYNYVFDPRVQLKGLFLEKKQDFIFLIDEAHNLVDRSREMFSAEIYKKDILELKRAIKLSGSNLYKRLTKLNTLILKYKKNIKEGETYYIQNEYPDKLYTELKRVQKCCEDWLKTGEGLDIYEKVLQFYFDIISFLRISELYNERYVSYVENKDKVDTKLKLFCIDPSKLLQGIMNNVNCIICFSATLSPLDYFCEILGGDMDSYKLRLDSPFPKDNLNILINKNISTKYHHREKSYKKIANTMYEIVKHKECGNYFAFFPSYNYMEKVYDIFTETYFQINTIIQSKLMKEADREEYLNNFVGNSKRVLIGFAVLGGVFSEGIDLVGEKLSGAIIVGVGLPQICFERDILRIYYDENKGKGFEYAYQYPGMNKVLQAAGRVIRTETDRGIIILIDERYGDYSYKKLFPQHWSNRCYFNNFHFISNNLIEFWHKSK